MYRSGYVCELSPYFPSQFAKKFGYEQLYVGNPCRALEHKGSLVDSVRAWRYFIMAYTDASFRMPTRDASLLTILAF